MSLVADEEEVMQGKISRRLLVQVGIAGASTLTVMGLLTAHASAAAPTPLDSGDPTAKALGFVADSTKVDKTLNPTHKEGQRCGTCVQFQGKAGDASGACNIFIGHTVPQGGWCKVWAQKPGA